jgi:hypothetical protein
MGSQAVNRVSQTTLTAFRGRTATNADPVRRRRPRHPADQDREADSGPLLPVTRERLDAADRTSKHVVVSAATKRPYKMVHFRHEFAQLHAAAELPTDLQVRDLRRTAATELGAARATDDEIRAVTGHTSRGIVAVYVRPNDRMARSAGEAHDGRTQVAKMIGAKWQSAVGYTVSP